MVEFLRLSRWPRPLSQDLCGVGVAKAVAPPRCVERFSVHSSAVLVGGAPTGRLRLWPWLCEQFEQYTRVTAHALARTALPATLPTNLVVRHHHHHFWT
jgi:hypothetical protein